MWYRSPGFFAYLLFPFAALYLIVIKLRRFLYRIGFLKVTQFSVPIIVVGNITVGGVGKSPLVAYLAQQLQKKGFKVGLVSRGYGGSDIGQPQCVTAESDPVCVGDEPVMLVRQTGCPMVVAKNRVAAVEKLLKESDCDVVISDDGLQHYALARDFEIAVIDGERKFGNGFCLPAGPLREPASRFKDVDLIVTNGIDMQLEPREICLIQDHQKTLAMTEKPIHLVTAIGNPSRFIQSVESLGFTVIPHIFPDHYFFGKEDLDYGPDAIVVMTEKDAVKCKHLVDDRHYVLTTKLLVSPRVLSKVVNSIE